MPNTHTLTQDVDFTQVLAPAVVTPATATVGTYIDMSGWEGGVLLFDVGAMAGTSTFIANLISGTTASGGTTANPTGATLVVIADTGGSSLYAISFRTSQLAALKRFVSVTYTVANANVTFSVILIRYRGRSLPVSTSLTQNVLMP
jgi:hypothetical protein